ncbi:guanine deaminase-like [Chrysoperla carnea]|uniref:guanine deaminase-like n=1 Tax=Chrysoperla carnea TaxID=189513 RepID=UPI001D06F698|nr:guanine deaminase-like [Chrysoperla carnea]
MFNYLFEGTIIHCPNRLELYILENGFLHVESGKVKYIGKTKPENIPADTISYKLTKYQFLIPGFIDTHIHAPQYPNIGLGYDVELLEWLDNYTFPTEIRFNDQDHAKCIYPYVVNRTLKNGTTTASYYGTTNLKSSIILSDVTSAKGQRAFIGLVNMTENAPPELLHENNDVSIKETEEFIKIIFKKKNELVQPVITPRFALSCNEDLLKRLGDLAAKYHVNIQTHISENKKEIEATLETYPGYKNYAEVYDKANLLTKKTILAHAVYLDDNEKNTVLKRGTSISHCPNSNICLHSGFCDVRDFLNRGINVGLGTDVSGGCSPSILDAIRSSITTSNGVSFSKSEEENYKSIDYTDAFYLATLGGAQALRIDDRVGNFKVGKEFDALLIDLDSENTPIDLHLLQDYTSSELLQKFIYLGDDRNINQVFVAGRCVVKDRNVIRTYTG